MGMLRFLLALSVVIQHSTPLFGHQLTTGIVAVQGFFVVSGFYMALILAEKYPATKQGTWLFYSNRFLRIYPVYWSVCGLFVVIWLLSKLFPGVVRPPGNALDLWIQWFPAFRWETIAYVVASNVALLGLDVGLFLKITDGALAFTSTLYQPEPRIYSLAFIPQAWTLGIEVIVYALAPFVFRLPTPALIVLAAASLALRGGICGQRGFCAPLGLQVPAVRVWIVRDRCARLSSISFDRHSNIGQWWNSSVWLHVVTDVLFHTTAS